MQEIELKILNISISTITKKLIALGAKKKKTAFVRAFLFDDKQGSLEKKKYSLRLRSVGSVNELTLKCPVDAQTDPLFKIREEIETTITDFTIAKILLERLGFYPIAVQEKKRTSFILGNVHCEIDEYPDIPPYLEIEGSQKNIVALLKKLGIKKEETTPLGALRVIASYGKDPTHCCF